LPRPSSKEPISPLSRDRDFAQHNGDEDGGGKTGPSLSGASSAKTRSKLSESWPAPKSANPPTPAFDPRAFEQDGGIVSDSDEDLIDNMDGLTLQSVQELQELLLEVSATGCVVVVYSNFCCFSA
jgi:hypothetical protein